jgi:hypothetical protein
VRKVASMTVDRWIKIIAGTMIIVSSALAWAFSPWWLLWTLFVGANLLQFGLTDFCPMRLILRKLGVPETCAAKTAETD